MREKYRREVAIEDKLSRSGAAASGRPTWSLMSFFRFMYQDNEFKQTTSNLDDTDVEVDTEYEIVEEETDHNYTLEAPDQDLSQTFDSPSTSANYEKAKKRPYALSFPAQPKAVKKRINRLIH